jgi:hypothetical protein
MSRPKADNPFALFTFLFYLMNFKTRMDNK